MKTLTLTRIDMYDKNGKCILPYGGKTRREINRSKYDPIKEDKKHLDEALTKGAHQ